WRAPSPRNSPSRYSKCRYACRACAMAPIGTSAATRTSATNGCARWCCRPRKACRPRLRLFEDVAHAHVFDFDVIVDAVPAAFAPQAGLLDAAERHVLGGQYADVDAHHAGLQRLGSPEYPAHVAAVQIAGQAEFRGVGGGDGLLVGMEAE